MPEADATNHDAVPRVGRQLEKLARGSLGRALFYSTSPEAIVDAQVALTLELLERERALRGRLLRVLVATECSLDTLVLPLPGYYLRHDQVRELWVRERLLLIDAERRQVLVEYERRVGELETQLLQLVGQRVMLRESGGPER